MQGPINLKMQRAESKAISEIDEIARRALALAEGRGVELKRLQAENAQMREALEEIGSGFCCQTRPGDFDDPCCDVMMAQAALSTVEETEE